MIDSLYIQINNRKLNMQEGEVGSERNLEEEGINNTNTLYGIIKIVMKYLKK